MPFLPKNLFPPQAVFRSGDTALTTDVSQLAPTAALPPTASLGW